MNEQNNPVIWADYPDPDVIRVGDTYYMISTTMHMFPGGVILRSYDLVHWETACHVYDSFDETPAQRLDGGAIYGKGMWAASLRYHGGIFHAVFCANDTHKMYHYTTEAIEGPWTRHEMSGFYHDCSILFDDDGRVYIVYGNTQIYLTELKSDLSGPKEGGISRMIIEDTSGAGLGYEGSHLYRIDGRYYIFMIHWPSDGNRRRTEVVYSADHIEGPWSGYDCLDDDMGFHNMGVAQGGIVDTPDGRMYAMLFQDHGAVGRIPVLVPVSFDGSDRDRPFTMGPVPAHIDTPDSRPGYDYRPLSDSDDFSSDAIRDIWQWNHEPDLNLVDTDPAAGRLILKSGNVVNELTKARNVLTQRTFGPCTHAEVTIDASGLKDGDIAGLCALQGLYAQIGIIRENERFKIVLIRRHETDTVTETVETDLGTVRLGADFDFEDMHDTVRFRYMRDGEWVSMGHPHQLQYRLDHFMGCRVGLYMYSTIEEGGCAAFSDFTFEL